MLPVFLFAAALGGSAPPPRLVPPRWFEFAGVALNETSLNAVVDRFGKASIWHTGDAAGSETKVCYSIGTGTEQRHVYFISNEMGGGDVNGVRVVTDGDERCSVPQHGADELRTTIAGFSAAAAVDRRLKSIGFVQTKPGEWSRCFQEKIHGQTYDNCSTVNAKWRDGALIELEVWVVESN